MAGGEARTAETTTPEPQRSKGEIIRSTFDRWSRGVRDVRTEDVDPDAEVVSQLADRVYRGYDGIRQWTADVLDSFDEWDMRLDQIRELGGERALAIGSVHVRGRGSGVDVNAPCAWLFDFRGGRMARMEIFINRVDDAIEAAELRD